MTYADTDLVASAGVPYARTLNYQINDVDIDWSLYTVTSQVRDYRGNLIFDLTPYLRVGSDTTELLLELPDTVTAVMPAEGLWDLLAVLISDAGQAFRTPRPAGRILVLAGITHA